MSVGSILVGVAVLAVVVAYVARPFRAAAGGVNLERTIEAWVLRVRDEEDVSREPRGERRRESAVDAEDAAINYCPQCGRQVAPDDRFCAGCGARLRGE